MILGSAILLLVQKATGDSLSTFGGLIVPFDDEWWRYLTAPFAYVDVGYLFVVAVGAGDLRAPGSSAGSAAPPTAILLLACGALGMLAAGGIANAQGDITVIAGGNGMALGAVAAWFAIRRAEAHGAIDEEYDMIGVVVAAVVLIALPLFASTANVFAGLVGGAVGGLAGLLAAAAATTSTCQTARCPSEERARSRDRAADRRRALRRGRADRRPGRAAAAEGARRGARRGRLVRRVARGRGAEGGDRPRPRRADRRGPRPARRGGADGDDGWRRRRLGTERRA